MGAHDAVHQHRDRIGQVLFIKNACQIALAARFQVWAAADTRGSPKMPSDDHPLGGSHIPRATFPNVDLDSPPKSSILPRDASTSNASTSRPSLPRRQPPPLLEPFHCPDTHVSYFIGADPAKRPLMCRSGAACAIVIFTPAFDLQPHRRGRPVAAAAHTRQYACRATTLKPRGTLSATRLSPGVSRAWTRWRWTIWPAPVHRRGGSPRATAARPPGYPLHGCGWPARPARPATYDVSPPFADGAARTLAVIHRISCSTPASSAAAVVTVGSDIAVDGAGQAYVTGDTQSADFPAVLGPGDDTSYNDGRLRCLRRQAGRDRHRPALRHLPRRQLQ